ncbi:SET domain-containing protein [Dothidotthia symphoricarpi CBS 119687]|uniref:SET domain-containing protein n=1 Tax=Dothidotthia symphoricarpi CBS 119687 TaxID=1392245 RepID=A0A6A6AM51_9PLEO|nr:SET domain-containing protein [Dothidotthia symphoricarpi CBS 119687]KAF2131957.1 SET domain-containing protein [Dothidotthia symphoricarpi CBS 119687]
MAADRLSPSSTSSMASHPTSPTEEPAYVHATPSASPPISTPPTSLGDAASVLSETTKTEQYVEAHDDTPMQHVSDEARAAPDTSTSETRRPARSSRKSVTTYNVQILAGTAIHTPTKYLEKHHKNVVHGSLEDAAKGEVATPPKKKTPRLKSETSAASDPAGEQLAAEAAQAARRRTSTRGTDLRKEALRNLAGAGDSSVDTPSRSHTLVKKTLRRSASTSTLPSATAATSSKRDSEQGYDSAEGQEQKEFQKPKTKLWMKQGLYVGQHRDFDARLSESQNRAKKRAKKNKESGVLPLPLFAGDRLLTEDPREAFRDFKLPFDTYSPLPRKVKVDGWVKLHRNRFIADASALWKRDKQDSSQCYCDPEDGCGEACHNRIMAYECDGTNCRLTAEQCGNRPFAELKKRGKGNRYDYGVEVLETDERGYGVRAMRTFEPHQIIVEYAGEIITQHECERRMKHVYKKDKCYYLMSFDNKMIIDATRGTIARFVNHSCEPNCEMIKWTVGGEPRMALFAGSRGIMTGEELTYDYNFDPFSQKNIQACRCGTESCRGVLGPKPKKLVEERSMASAFIAGTKRKIQDVLGSGRSTSESYGNSPKRLKSYTGNSATTKAKNASAQSEAARERSEKEAVEHSRQIASRENRAMKRSVPPSGSRRSQSAFQRKSDLSFKSTRLTTVSFQRKVSKPGALRGATTSTRMHAALRRPTLALKGKKGIRPYKRPITPIKSSFASVDSEDDASPNITPASLRSASHRRKQITDARDVLRDKSPSCMSENELEGGREGARSRARKAGVGAGAGDVPAFHPAQKRSRSMRGR